MKQAFVAFKFRMQQNMLVVESKRKAYSKKLADILQQLAHYDADFIFGCELGGLQQGVKYVDIDMNKIVHSALPIAECETSGAYFAVNNCLTA